MDPKSSKRTRWYLIIGILLLILVLFFFGWIPRHRHTEEIDALAAAHPLPRVIVMTISPNKKPTEIVLPSSAQAINITPIWARTNGYIVNFLVDIGDFVKEGDLLAVIDTPEIDQMLEEARAELQNSIVQRDIAKVTSDRWQGLYNKNREAVTKQDVDQNNANTQAAEATVQANERNVARLNFQKEFQKVYAPFDGVITQRNIDIGSLVYGNINGTPQELFTIAKTDIIRFFTNVPQNYFRQIKEGLNVEVSINEFPGKLFNGLVTRFANALDPVARTMLTQVDVENKDGEIYAGLYGKVKFIMYPETENFIIPTTAIIIRDSYPHVAVVDENDIIQLKRVQIGIDYGKNMDIPTGLKNKDRIVVLPSDAVVKGAKVEIIKDLSAPKEPEAQKKS